ELEVDEVADPLVDPLVARADEDQVRTRREIGGAGLAKHLAARIEQDDGRFGAAQLIERGRERLPPQDHARAAAVRSVVDAPVPAEAPPAQVVDPDLGQAALADAAGNALRERTLEHGREQAHDVDLEGHGLGPLPCRDQGGRRRGGRAPAAATGPSIAGVARSSTASSTISSPRSGAKVVITLRTAGMSNSPTAPPRTTYTSVSPARYTSATVPSTVPVESFTVVPITSCQYAAPSASSEARSTATSRYASLSRSAAARSRTSRKRRRQPGSSSTSVTFTASGSSTSDRATYSTSSFALISVPYLSAGSTPALRNSRATVFDGSAPLASQAFAFSASTWNSIGSLRGL